MQYQDPDPERRNLTVTSLAFIAYYLGGGNFVNGDVKLQIINVRFDHQDTLVVMAWTLLWWFLWRYWLTHRTSALDNLNSDLSNFRLDEHVKWYASKTLEKPYGITNGIVIERLRAWTIIYKLISSYRPHTNSMSLHPNENELKITGWRGMFLKNRLRVIIYTTKPGFGSYAVPYLLFAGVHGLAIWKNFLSSAYQLAFGRSFLFS